MAVKAQAEDPSLDALSINAGASALGGANFPAKSPKPLLKQPSTKTPSPTSPLNPTAPVLQRSNSIRSSHSEGNLFLDDDSLLETSSEPIVIKAPRRVNAHRVGSRGFRTSGSTRSNVFKNPSTILRANSSSDLCLLSDEFSRRSSIAEDEKPTPVSDSRRIIAKIHSLGEEGGASAGSISLKETSQLEISAMRLLDEGVISQEEYLQLLQCEVKYQQESVDEEEAEVQQRVSTMFGESWCAISLLLFNVSTY